MKLSKRTKNIGMIILAIAAVIIGPGLISDLRLRGTWQNLSWAKIKADYGLRVGLFSNAVTMRSSPNLKGTLAGNTITWSDGNTWTRTA